jgi:large subunit ribosomal protein L4
MTDTLVEAPSILAERCNDSGDLLGVVQLDLEYFGIAVNVALLHQVVTAQLAAKRSGTHSTKTRAEVAGGGAKPYRQKGTGRARQGTIRAPQFAGGGIAFGPKPRDYSQSTPRKMVRQALRAALSDRAAEGRIRLVDRWSFETPKTKQAVRSLEALGVDGKVLVVLGSEDVIAERSFGNLRNVLIVEGGQLTAYDVVISDWVVFTDETIPGEVSDAPEGSVVTNSTRPVKSDDAGETEADDAAGETEDAADDDAGETEDAADETDDEAVDEDAADDEAVTETDTAEEDAAALSDDDGADDEEEDK